jgi:hypothetical protein
MLFFRRSLQPDIGTAQLGAACVAVRAGDGALVPPGATGVVFDQAGRIRRVAGGARLILQEGESAVCFHPGPYRIEVVPFAAAPEIGLAVTFAVDAADPRVAQQRFDLYLATEAAGELPLAALRAAIEGALRRELAQGNLELPPCTSLDEWNAFRAGFNRLVYTRFGVTVDDCLPVDLGERVDYAQMLRAPSVAGVSAQPAPPASTAPAPIDAASMDRQALRRLFLELPSVMCALRLATPAPGAFRLQRALLQRLDLACMQVNTMPALELAAPGQAVAGEARQRRARASLAAASTLDEAWAWLARAQGPCGDALFDEFDRIAANLEQALAERRAVEVP